MSTGRKNINVLIAISNNVLCEGLRKITAEDSQNTAFCLSGCNVLPQPNIVLFDYPQDVQTLKLNYPEAKPILLDTGLKEQDIACLLICHKIKGIISPDASLEMFHKAIRVVDKGEIWIDQRHLKLLLHRNGALTDSGEIKCLSAQDKKIIQLITEGYKNREIGEALCLSEHTIKAHVSRIFKLLNVRNRSQLVNFAKEYNSDLQQL